VPARHYGRWVAIVVLLILAAMLAHDLLTNPRFEWHIVFSYFTSQRIINGLYRTLELTAIAMVIGLILGVLLAVMKMSENPVVSSVAGLYIWFFRGTPVFVQLLFWGFISALQPAFSLGIPFGPSFVSFNANHLITPLVAAILGLGLNEGAYMSEIVRAGIISVDEGQVEAALGLGMTRARTLRRIVLPQAMRVIIPPIGNQTISMLKSTSLVSVLAVPELLYSAQLIYGVNFQTIPLLITASLWYLIVTSILTVGQFYLERRFGRSIRGGLPETPWQRARAWTRRMSGMRWSA
jgi:polar amino acid transport system permease protein